MKEILVISGKGGTGKTSLTAALAQLATPCVVADCDVDAADLYMLLPPATRQTVPFFAGFLPEFDFGKCTKCGRCAALCRFQAISSWIELRTDSCEGCGVCADHCPRNAISMVSRHCGEYYLSDTPCGAMVHARLLPGAENSGKLVAEVRKKAKEVAEEKQSPYLLSDGPPGIGCPVISAMTGVDFALIVTEPTVSGLHDMMRVAALARNFEVDFQVVVNKYDLNPSVTEKILEFCRRNGTDVAGKIPFDPVFSHALREGKTVLEYPETIPAQEISRIWDRIKTYLNQGKES